MEGRCMYLFHCEFSSCSESTEIWHANSFCFKKMSLCFFSRRQINMEKIARKSNTPSLSLSICQSQNTVHVCFTLLVGGSGGVVDFQECV